MNKMKNKLKTMKKMIDKYIKIKKLKLHSEYEEWETDDIYGMRDVIIIQNKLLYQIVLL